MKQSDARLLLFTNLVCENWNCKLWYQAQIFEAWIAPRLSSMSRTCINKLRNSRSFIHYSEESNQKHSYSCGLATGNQKTIRLATVMWYNRMWFVWMRSSFGTRGLFETRSLFRTRNLLKIKASFRLTTRLACATYIKLWTSQSNRRVSTNLYSIVCRRWTVSDANMNVSKYRKFADFFLVINLIDLPWPQLGWPSLQHRPIVHQPEDLKGRSLQVAMMDSIFRLAWTDWRVRR